MIVGIDLGSSHVRAVGCIYDEHSKYPSVVAVYKKHVEGIVRGTPSDEVETGHAVREAIASLEDSSGRNTLHTIVSVGGIGLSSYHANGHAQVSRGDASVTELDIDNAIKDATRGIPDVRNKSIIHSISMKNRLDGNEIHGNVLGVRGNRLEVKTLFVTYPLQCMNSLQKSLRSTRIRVSDMIAGPIAESLPLLTKKQKVAGVALISIGAQVTSLIVYENSSPLLVSTLPVGGDDFTKDIALGLKITLEDAEEIKCGRLSPQYHKRRVEEIIGARLEDMCTKINKELTRIGRQELLPAGIIISGISSALPNVEAVFRSELRLPVRIITTELARITDDTLKDPSWARAYGLTFLAPSDREQDAFKELLSTFLSRAKKFMHRFLP
jgi:cell division protein FtsA